MATVVPAPAVEAVVKRYTLFTVAGVNPAGSAPTQGLPRGSARTSALQCATPFAGHGQTAAVETCSFAAPPVAAAARAPSISAGRIRRNGRRSYSSAGPRDARSPVRAA